MFEGGFIVLRLNLLCWNIETLLIWSSKSKWCSDEGNGYSLMRPCCHKLRLVCCDRRQKYSIFLWAQEDGTWSQWFNGHHIMFLLTTSYHSIGTSLLNSTKDEWLKRKSFCFRLFSSYESIIGVRCDENSEVVKKNCNSIQQQNAFTLWMPHKW